MKNIVLIQARLGSTRFPGKILQTVWSHLSALEAMVERVKLSRKVDKIIICTTDNQNDRELIDLCNQKSWNYYIGPENDVMDRMCGAIIDFSHEEDRIIDLTSDCILVDPKMIDTMIGICEKHDYDFFSNTVVRSFFDGADIQIAKAKLILEVDKIIPNPQHRTHFCWNCLAYLGLLQEKFDHMLIVGHYSTGKDDFMPTTRLVLDNPEDLEVLRNVFKHFNRIDFTYKEIIQLIKENKSILAPNKEIESKVPGID